MCGSPRSRSPLSGGTPSVRRATAGGLGSSVMFKSTRQRTLRLPRHNRRSEVPGAQRAAARAGRRHARRRLVPEHPCRSADNDAAPNLAILIQAAAVRPPIEKRLGYLLRHLYQFEPCTFVRATLVAWVQLPRNTVVCRPCVLFPVGPRLVPTRCPAAGSSALHVEHERRHPAVLSHPNVEKREERRPCSHHTCQTG